MTQAKRSNKWRSDLLLIRENIRWMEKVGALQLSFGFSLEFVSVMQLVMETGVPQDTLRPMLHLCFMLCGLCVIVCGFVIRGLRNWGTCGYAYAGQLVNCACLAVLLLPLGFTHHSGCLVTLVSQYRVNISSLRILTTNPDGYTAYLNSYIFLYFTSNMLMAFCIALCAFQAHLCCFTVSFRERDLCFPSMFVKFGLGLFQWINVVRNG